MNPAAASSAVAQTARLELGLAAMASERRNRPWWLIVVAGLSVLVAIGYAIVGFSARTEAGRRLRSAQARQTTYEALIGEINRLKAAEAERGFAPDSHVAANLEERRGAGLKLIGPISDTESQGGVTGMARKAYAAHVGNEDPKALLNWLNQVRVSPQFKGLELSKITVNTGAGSYSSDIEFSRWEKR